MGFPFGEADVTVILDEMSAGAKISVGHSRAHVDYFARDGDWYRGVFDEGGYRESTCSEEEVRGAIERDPQPFVPLVIAPHWRGFSAAFLRGDRESARRHLHRSLVWGDPLERGKVLEAVLAWPEEHPSPEAMGLITERIGSHTAFHLFMDIVGWEQTPENGRRGVAFVEQLIDMVGEVPLCWKARASFRQMAGDLAGALGDLERELALTPEGDWWQKQLHKDIERLLGLGEP